MDRREFVVTAALAGTGVVSLSACGGGGEPTPSRSSPASAAASASAWDIIPPPVLLAGQIEVVFNLEPSLPDDVRRGGRFAVSPTGNPLPDGVALTPSGILSVTSESAVSEAVGVVFFYEEPAA